jgi:acyl-CoA reductase-like NAD-dependent aldehyde dehydrogenase
VPTALPVIDPRRGEKVAAVDAAAPQQIADHVAAAAEARDAWAGVLPAERIAVVRRLVDVWTAAEDELVERVLVELGQPERFTRTVHIENAVRGAGVLADLAESIVWAEQVGEATVQREPVGVVAALTPWNYPVHQVVAKVAGALLAGCPVVVKPSELAPLSVAHLIDVARPLVPSGVLTLVQGGPEAGVALVADERVDLVSFTGSAAVGRQVAADAARAGTPTVLELGGRSPAVLLDDLDGASFARAVRFVVADALSNAGQTCNALSRLVVPRARRDEAVEAALAAASRFTPGGMLGPVRRAQDVDRLTAWVADAEAAGARILLDGRAIDGLEGGSWFGPTVVDLDGVSDQRFTDEVFGPVLTLEPYDDEGPPAARDAAAVAACNVPSLGLSAAVWAADRERAEAVGRSLRVGQVRIDGARWDFRLPFGGFSAAGWGREWGRAGIEAFTTTRVIAR